MNAIRKFFTILLLMISGINAFSVNSEQSLDNYEADRVVQPADEFSSSINSVLNYNYSNQHDNDCAQDHNGLHHCHLGHCHFLLVNLTLDHPVLMITKLSIYLNSFTSIELPTPQRPPLV